MSIRIHQIILQGGSDYHKLIDLSIANILPRCAPSLRAINNL
jgi:hypothetical protein